MTSVMMLLVMIDWKSLIWSPHFPPMMVKSHWNDTGVQMKMTARA